MHLVAKTLLVFSVLLLSSFSLSAMPSGSEGVASSTCAPHCVTSSSFEHFVAPLVRIFEVLPSVLLGLLLVVTLTFAFVLQLGQPRPSPDLTKLYAHFLK